jgi:hypothetical protein
MLSKKEILQLAPSEEVVEISGGKVQMRGLSAREYGDYERELFTQGPDGMLRAKPIDGAFRARLVAKCLTDEDGETFTDEEVGSLDAAVVSKLYDVARRLCGVSEADESELAAVFAPAQGNGSSTA